MLYGVYKCSLYLLCQKVKIKIQDNITLEYERVIKARLVNSVFNDKVKIYRA